MIPFKPSKLDVLNRDLGPNLGLGVSFKIDPEFFLPISKKMKQYNKMQAD